MGEGRTAEACARFADSQRIEPMLGTLLNLATCHERLGLAASAWAEFTRAAAQARQARQPEREAMAVRHIAALEPKLSRLVIGCDEPAAGETITLDGMQLGMDTIGTALPLDVGAHSIEASAPGRRTWQGSVLIEPGPAEQRLEIPKLDRGMAVPDTARAPQTSPAEPAPRAAATTAPHPPPAASKPERAKPEHSAHTGVWIASSVAVTALAIGTYYFVHAVAVKHDAEQHCTGDGCTPEGLTLFDQVDREAAVATVAFGVALAAGGVDVYFLLKNDSRSPASAQIRNPGAANVVITGRW